MPETSPDPKVDHVIDLTEPETVHLDPPLRQQPPVAPAAPTRSGAVPVVIVLGIVLAVVAGIGAFILTRTATDPTGADEASMESAAVVGDKADNAGDLDRPIDEVAPALSVPAGLIGQPVSVVAAELVDAGFRVEQMAEVLDRGAGFGDDEVLSISPAPGTDMQPDDVVTVTYAVLRQDDAPAEARTLAPATTEPFTPSIGWAGSPAGSGCTPGPGSLPDGTWFGFVQGQSGGEMRFDLICYDGINSTHSNQNPLVRTVPLAGDLRVECPGGPCSMGVIDYSRVTGIRIEGGFATVLYNGVGL